MVDAATYDLALPDLSDDPLARCGGEDEIVQCPVKTIIRPGEVGPGVCMVDTDAPLDCGCCKAGATCLIAKGGTSYCDPP